MASSAVSWPPWTSLSRRASRPRRALPCRSASPAPATTARTEASPSLWPRAASRGRLAGGAGGAPVGLGRGWDDCSDGGIAVALAESCVSGPARVGCRVVLDGPERRDLALFGEGPSRILVEVEGGRQGAFEALMGEWAIPWSWI